MAEAAIVQSDRSHWMHHPVAKTAVLGLLALSLITAGLLGFEILSGDVAFDVSSIVYVVVPLGAGVVVMGAALTLDGKRKIAWLVIGAGVLAWSPPWFLETASMAAHRANGGPCLVIDPRWTLLSDSRCRGVNPAHEQTCLADVKRVTSPNSAHKVAPRTGPTPWIAWMAS